MTVSGDRRITQGDRVRSSRQRAVIHATQRVTGTRSGRLGYFVVQTDHPERTRLLVEMFLERETKRWQLDGSTGNRNGDRDGRGVRGLLGNRDAHGPTTLMYLVRFRKHEQPQVLLERLRAVGAPAEFTADLEIDPEVKERMA